MTTRTVGWVGIDRERLERARGSVVPDLIGPDCRLLVVGINPGLWSAVTGVHFAHPGNRFWPAMLAAGIVEREIPRGAPWSDEDRTYVISRGLGITNLVARATANAAELTTDELRAGVGRLRDVVSDVGPRVVAVAGITAYRSGFGDRSAGAGRQPEGLAGAEVWVVPNPSGLNAHETVGSLAAAYRVPAERAGVVGGGADAR